MKKSNLSFSVAGLVLMTSGAAMAQSTGVSHPDDVMITTSATGQTAAAVPAATVPVDRYAAPQPAPRPVPLTDVAQTNQDSLLNSPPPMAPAGPDQDGGVVVRIPGPSDRLPEGTLLKVRIRETISTRQTKDGSEWSGELIEPLERDGQVLVPAGSIVHGKVTEVHGGQRIHGQAAIHLTTLAMTLPDGSSRGLHAQVIDTDLDHALRIDNEGTILHREHRKEEASVMALTVGSGAAAGAIIAGVPGALVGAGVGAGVTGVLYLKEDKQAELPHGTIVTFELTRSVGFGQE